MAIRKLFLFGVLISLSVMIGVSAEAFPLDLSLWSPQDWNFGKNQAANLWQVSEANKYFAYQFNDAGPSAYLNNANWASYQVEGFFRVMNSGCFGVVGFVFGYQDPSHFYLFDWKRYNSETVGNDGIGFAIKKFSAPSLSDLEFSDFRSSTSTDNMEILMSSYGPFSRWSPFSTYHFLLDYERGIFHIEIKSGESLNILWDAAVNDSAGYDFGQFGFYNFHQGAAIYYGFSVATCSPAPDPEPVPEPSAVLLLISGLAGLAAMKRKLNK